jgi:hypothetical protein
MDTTSGISQELNDLCYTAISLYVKDTSLKAEQILSYDLNGLYKTEKDLVVGSSIDGLGCGVRLYILSNHALPQAGSNSLFVIPKGDHLKLIGRPTYQGKGALILLHVPQEHWQEFKKDTFLIDTLLINYATREFEVQCDSKYRRSESDKSDLVIELTKE